MTAPDDPTCDDGDRAALFARLATAARAPYDDVDLGFHEPAEPRAPRVPLARFRPNGAAMTMPSRRGGTHDIQVEAAVALGLPRWHRGAVPGPVPRWLLRLTSTGLELMTPAGIVLARARRTVPAPWRAGAFAHGVVLVTYGHDVMAGGVIRCRGAA